MLYDLCKVSAAVLEDQYQTAALQGPQMFLYVDPTCLQWSIWRDNAQTGNDNNVLLPVRTCPTIARRCNAQELAKTDTLEGCWLTGQAEAFC